MKALIVEDEMMARRQLMRMLEEGFADVEVVGTTDSIASTVDFLKANPAPDVIFMDVELLDGDCFEIFRRVDVVSRVIMTTAYDTYAVKAFEAGSVDYLLKPVDQAALNRAVSRCREKISGTDVARLLAAVGKTRYKEKSTVRCGDRIIPVSADEIAYFFAEDKANYLMTGKGCKYIIDSTMEQLEGELNPEKFFRISRSCIVNSKAIVSVSAILNGRLAVTAEPKPPFEMTVSRGRVDDFLAWLG